MKKFPWLFALLVSFHPVARAQETGTTSGSDKVNQIIEQVRQKYAPDKRTDVFEATVFEAPLEIDVDSTSAPAIAELKDLLKKANIEAVVDEKLLPDAALGGKTYGVANLSVCNNRVQPRNAAELSTQMLLGTPIEILKRERGYYLVRTPDKYISWTDDAGISPMDRATFQKWQDAEKVVYTAEYGHSYAEPSSSAPRVSDLVRGDMLQVFKKSKGYYQVAYPDGKIAYVPVSELTKYESWISGVKPDADHIIEAAKTLVGVPYLWGGTSNKGVDCSGLTKTAFFMNGVIIPRDASQQALVGNPVDIAENGIVSTQKCLANLLPGDLLFFGGSRGGAGAPRVVHTAIYIGQGVFIQAAGFVRINSLVEGAPNYDEHERSTLLSARRILNALDTPEITRIDHHPFYNPKIAK